MQNVTKNSGQKTTTKVAPLSCHCKLSLLVVHLQYLTEKRNARRANLNPVLLTEANALFYQYI
ncbi:hypothetical protein HUW51_14570 [Adhaeribacter swui]|uniref:Uncharacterized protein n=1 Tax=Adhaeribacter swui TaxID=2086471 RepID=A0A7G7G9Q1_9BACT|nr:hypothetical protein [Adhaeribacter swui]QNF33885.1 hypothetical protein HUW51_14570 [Adhaeribacter swui]